MEDVAFIVTALICAFIAFVTRYDTRYDRNVVSDKKGLEKEIVLVIQTYVDTKIQQLKAELVKNQLEKQEYIEQCILFRSVNVCEEIQVMIVEKIGTLISMCMIGMERK